MKNNSRRNNSGAVPLEQEEFMTTAEVARWLNVSRRTVVTAVHKGAIPAFVAGHIIRIPRSRAVTALRTLLAGCRQRDDVAARKEKSAPRPVALAHAKRRRASSGSRNKRTV